MNSWQRTCEPRDNYCIFVEMYDSTKLNRRQSVD